MPSEQFLRGYVSVLDDLDEHGSAFDDFTSADEDGAELGVVFEEAGVHECVEDWLQQVIQVARSFVWRVCQDVDGQWSEEFGVGVLGVNDGLDAELERDSGFGHVGIGERFLGVGFRHDDARSPVRVHTWAIG